MTAIEAILQHRYGDVYLRSKLRAQADKLSRAAHGLLQAIERGGVPEDAFFQVTEQVRVPPSATLEIRDVDPHRFLRTFGGIILAQMSKYPDVAMKVAISYSGMPRLTRSDLVAEYYPEEFGGHPGGVIELMFFGPEHRIGEAGAVIL